MKRLILLCLLLDSFVVSAQTEDFVTEKIQLNYLGLSESTIIFSNIPLIGSTREKIGDDREGRRKNQINNPAALLKGLDPVLQASMPTINIAINQQLTIEGPD